jgi:hypothetical protein
MTIAITSTIPIDRAVNPDLLPFMNQWWEKEL